MKTGNSWLRSAGIVAAGIIVTVLVISPDAHVWNFDQDKAGEVPAGWKALEGDWQVIADPSAPSKPNTFGLPAGRLLQSLNSALQYYPMAIQSDPTEYSDF